MSKKATSFTATEMQILLDAKRRGLNRHQIAKELYTQTGRSVSASTVESAVKKVLGSTPKKVPLILKADLNLKAITSETEDAEESDSDGEPLASGACLEQIERWIGQVEGAIETARNEGDLKTLGSLLRVAAQLSDQRRRQMPPRAPDPNENPDMIACRDKALAEFHRIIDHKLTTKVAFPLPVAPGLRPSRGEL